MACRSLYLVSALLVLLHPVTAAAACTVCHSKKPEMVRMHKTLQSRQDIGCFDCHRVGEKLMGKGQPKDRESILRRRSSDKVCQSCHNGT